MLIRLKTITLSGLDPNIVEVEVDLHRGLPSFQIVGLTDTAIQESRERVRSAIKNSGFEFPRQKIVVNLAPASLRKNGPRFDLPIALGILAATGQVDLGNTDTLLSLGELSFTGELRGVPGTLPTAAAAANAGFTDIIVPCENAKEAALIEAISVRGARTLAEVVGHFRGSEIVPTAEHLLSHFSEPPDSEHDFAHIKGQEHAKRALEIAAAGGHNILMVGPPGSGKTMLAKAFPTILPPLTTDEALQITQVHSVAGLTSADAPVLLHRPFRVVHHTASGVAIVGGGNPPSPGEISLAHRGVLFLDEFAEFAQKTLEVLRQPMEEGVITVSRASGSFRFPARFTLVAAMNPTPGGYSPNDARCKDSAHAIARYQNKISGPILDRIDVHLSVPHIPFEKLAQLEIGESSQTIRTRVTLARERQQARFEGEHVLTNSEMTSPQVKQFCQMDDIAQGLLQAAVAQMGLSGRAYYRVLKLARTIADLDQAEHLAAHHVAEAIGLRQQKVLDV